MCKHKDFQVINTLDSYAPIFIGALEGIMHA